ncbi:hypothetical protein [Amycolatopsis sp. NPDC054798]
MTDSTPDAPRDVDGTHPRAGTGAIFPAKGDAIPRRPGERPFRLFVRKRARRLSASTEQELFAPDPIVRFGGNSVARPAAGSGRATTTVRGEQSR